MTHRERAEMCMRILKDYGLIPIMVQPLTERIEIEIESAVEAERQKVKELVEASTSLKCKIELAKVHSYWPTMFAADVLDRLKAALSKFEEVV